MIELPAVMFVLLLNVCQQHPPPCADVVAGYYLTERECRAAARIEYYWARNRRCMARVLDE